MDIGASLSLALDLVLHPYNTMKQVDRFIHVFKLCQELQGAIKEDLGTVMFLFMLLGMMLFDTLSMLSVLHPQGCSFLLLYLIQYYIHRDVAFLIHYGITPKGK